MDVRAKLGVRSIATKTTSGRRFLAAVGAGGPSPTLSTSSMSSKSPIDRSNALEYVPTSRSLIGSTSPRRPFSRACILQHRRQGAESALWLPRSTLASPRQRLGRRLTPLVLPAELSHGFDPATAAMGR